MYWESAIELSMINQTQDSLFAGDNELVTGLGLSLDIVDPDLVRGFNEEYPMATNDQTWLSPQTSEMDSQPEASTYSPYTSLTRRPQRPQSLNDNFQPSLHVTPISTAQRWYGWSNQSFDHSSSYSSPYVRLSFTLQSYSCIDSSQATCLSPTGGSDHMGSLTSTSTTPWSINSSYPNPTQYNAVDSPCGAMTEEDYLKDDIGLSYLNFDHTLTEESCLDPALEPQSPCPQSEISSCTSTEQTQIREDSISRHSIIYACNICGIEYNRRSSLKSHLRSHATKRTKAQCPKDGCGKTYGRQADLARHIRSVSILFQLCITKARLIQRDSFTPKKFIHVSTVVKNSTDQTSETGIFMLITDIREILTFKQTH